MSRQACTKDSPRPPGAPGQWSHESVVEVGEQEDGWPGGDHQRYKCLDCGTTWKAELPQ